MNVYVLLSNGKQDAEIFGVYATWEAACDEMLAVVRDALGNDDEDRAAVARRLEYPGHLRVLDEETASFSDRYDAAQGIWAALQGETETLFIEGHRMRGYNS